MKSEGDFEDQSTRGSNSISPWRANAVAGHRMPSRACSVCSPLRHGETGSGVGTKRVKFSITASRRRIATASNLRCRSWKLTTKCRGHRRWPDDQQRDSRFSLWAMILHHGEEPPLTAWVPSISASVEIADDTGKSSTAKGLPPQTASDEQRPHWPGQEDTSAARDRRLWRHRRGWHLNSRGEGR